VGILWSDFGLDIIIKDIFCSLKTVIYLFVLIKWFWAK
jgi:hypothetical protein